MNLIAISHPLIRSIAVAGVFVAVSFPAQSNSTTPAGLLSTYTAQAGSPANPARGEQFFTSRHGREWSCSSCHGPIPTQTGMHAVTGKAISALAPNVSAERFTDSARVEKWFRRNCNDVVGRECSVAEKADLLSWLITLKR